MTKFRPLAMGFHSHVLSLDSCSSATSKILNASAQGRVADVVTDHGVLSGIAGHYLASEKLFKDGKTPTKIKSIHGCEIYMVDEDRPPKVYKNGRVDPQYYHLTIHFKTQAAYQYFCELSPVAEGRAVVRFGERKPLIYFKELEPIAGQITIGTGCIGSPVGKNILTGRKDLAIQWYERLRNLAGPGNLYAEVLPHICNRSWVAPKVSKEGMILEQGYFGPAIQRMDANALDAPFDPDPCTGEIDLQRPANQFVIDMAKKYGDPCVVSLDDHFSKEEDYAVQSAMLSNGNERFRFYNKYFAMDSDQAADAFKKQMNTSDRDIEEWIDNGYKFVELFNDYKFVTAKDRILLPTTEMVYNVKTDSLTVLRRLIDKYGMMPKEDHPQYQVYKDRLEYEISVLRDNGLADFLPYLFVVEDAASFCRKNSMTYNVRGSSGGCLILFLIGVSITDPIKYDLPLERFVTVERLHISPADVDFDIEDREPLISYLYEKYGERVGLISTDLLMRLKTSILDVERADKGRVPLEVSDMCKYIKGASQGQSDKDWLFGYVDKETDTHVPGFMEDMKDATAHRLREYSKSNPEIWDTVLKCIGVAKGRGVHAGGVVITPGPIQGFFPMINSNKGLSVAYEMKALEAVGGIKYDFLGVSTLKAIGIAFKSIKEHTGKQLLWEEPPHQKEVYNEIIGKGRLAGIFQISTKTVKPGVDKLRPSSIQEIANLTSLYRPSAMEAPSPDPSDGAEVTAVDYYIACKQGRRSTYLIHEDLRPILGSTYGIILFQEQTLKIFKDLAGYSLSEAEACRRAVGKKDKDLLDLHTRNLQAALLKRGWSQQQATRLFDSIMASARYSFNCSHAVSYSIVAYLGCWLKYNYPLHFWKGQLQISDAEEIQGLLHECGDLILDVSATKSHPFEWTIEGTRLRAPLSIVKGVGGKAAERLYEAGKGMHANP